MFFIAGQVRFLFEGLTSGAGRPHPLALFVCTTLHRPPLRGKRPRRLLLKSGKSEGWGLGAFKSGRPEPALMRPHLGTGCSAEALSQSPPAAQQTGRGKGSDPEVWSVSSGKRGWILHSGHFSRFATDVCTLIASVGAGKDNSLVLSEDIRPFHQIARDL